MGKISDKNTTCTSDESFGSSPVTQVISVDETAEIVIKSATEMEVGALKELLRDVQFDNCLLQEKLHSKDVENSALKEKAFYL